MITDFEKVNKGHADETKQSVHVCQKEKVVFDGSETQVNIVPENIRGTVQRKRDVTEELEQEENPQHQRPEQLFRIGNVMHRSHCQAPDSYSH